MDKPLDKYGQAPMRECACVELNEIARAMPDQVRRARVEQKHVAAMHASGLTDCVHQPHRASRFVIITGMQQDILATLKLVHTRNGWKSASAVLHHSDKELADMKCESFDVARGEEESPYQQGQWALANARVLIITPGVAQSRSAGPTLLEVVQTRLAADRDLWLVSPDESPIEQAATYSADLHAVLARFRLVRLGDALAPRAATVKSASGVAAKAKTTAAKYPGVCKACAGSFGVGDQIAWGPNRARLHATCA